MKERYGYNYVCQGGSYTTFGSKGALKDLGKAIDLDFARTNYVSAAFSDAHTKMIDVFKDAKMNSDKDKPSPIKTFIESNFDIFEDMGLIIGQPKVASTTASAVVIVPKEDEDGNPMTVFDWLPVRNDKDGNLTTEWQKGELEDAGFLKEDILAVAQLDKFSTINNLLIENGKEVLDFEQIQEEGIIDDKKVYELFHKGFNQDVFQFGTSGLTGYSLEVKPDNFSELVDMTALFRPGPMESHAHTDYVKIKHGEKKPEYDFGVREITRPTKSLLIFQEQVMKVCQDLGGFSLVEADDIRKAMGKKKIEILEAYQDRFIASAIEKGCDPIEAETIWHKLVVFAGYGFNKSHAVAYAVMSYMSQYHKQYNPVEYWTSSLHHCKDKGTDLLSHRINEIFQLDSHIKLMTVDVNESNRAFTPDFKNSIIYWSLGKIPYIGDAGIECILEEREKNGMFFSVEEFRERISGKKVTSRGVENLILSGGFDNVCNLKQPKERIKLINEAYGYAKKEVPEVYLEELDNTFWVLKQKELTGLGYLRYKSILKDKCSHESIVNLYKNPSQIQLDSSVDKMVGAAGVLIECDVKRTKKGAPYAQLLLDNNNELFKMTVWSELWIPNAKDIKNAKGKILAIKAKVKGADRWNKANTLNSAKQGSIIEVLN